MRYPGSFFCVVAAMLLWGGAGQLRADSKRVERYDASLVSLVSISGRFQKVELVATDNGPVEFEVTGTEERSGSVEATLEDGVLRIRNAGSDSMQRVNNSVNIAIGNAKSTLTIGDKTLSSSSGGPEASVTLRCPKVIDLQASGVFDLLSVIPLNKIDLKLVSGGVAHIEKSRAEDVQLECVGDTSATVYDAQHADVAVKVVGGGHAELKGSFRSVSVESVGANDMRISGPVSGSYAVSIIGRGILTHSGVIAGQVEKFVTGKGRFIHVEE